MLAAAALALVPTPALARVVINEIMYHAPDDLDDLEYIELHNTGAEAVNLEGWRFTKGIKFQFPKGAQVAGNGFLLLARNVERMQEAYNLQPAALFSEKLSNKGERLELADKAGATVDTVHFRDAAPWPLGADGHSGSLERIAPEGPGDNPANWISSPLSTDRRRPGGTPGQVNAGFAATMPPVISGVRFAPSDPMPGQAVTVEARVAHAGQIREATLLYRLAGPSHEQAEVPVPLREGGEGHYQGTIPAQAKDQLVRFRIRAVDSEGAARYFPAPSEPRPAFSYYVHETIQPAKIPFAWIITTTPEESPGRSQRRRGYGPWDESRVRPQTPHRSAFFHYDPATRKTELFDFVQVTPRKGGRKVHFNRDQPFEEMTAINLIFEEDERFPITEFLSYEVYKRAGMAAEKAGHVRLWVNNQPLGFQLLVEQPNRAFLRRNQLRDDGNLYKLIWYGNGLIGQHEKKTNTREGHEDLIQLVQALGRTEGREQWEVIRGNFDVPQVANYFAVNTALSYWDGFFNNYFAYHDVRGSGKWTMYPWDQDKTWGVIDGRRGVFYDMPLTFGMNGDTPPGSRRAPPPGMFRGDWWRPPGWFSGPLLANPYFRRFYLARTKELAEKVYTEKEFNPPIDALGARLRDEVRLRADLHGEDPAHAVQRFEHTLQALREHIQKRRAFILAQPEIQNVPSPAP